jgi:hypothetical protein
MSTSLCDLDGDNKTRIYMKQKSQLVIISIPLTRIARNSLSNSVLDPLRARGDVLIVAPFADEPGFQRDFSGKNTYFLQWQDNSISKIKKVFLSVPELMRRLGYWRKFKNKGLMYYLLNQYTNFGAEGKDSRFGIFRTFIYWLLSVIGKHPSTWEITEKCCGRGWYNFPGLLEFSNSYEKVSLIQSANWGMQDRVLARVSSGQDWRKVLLPYTTDQLFTNGFLLNKFDAVCVQGDFELGQAKDFHFVPEDRIFKLGSAWFRHMQEIQSKNNIGEKPKNETPLIIYAGVTNTNFPSKSEFQALDAIVEFVESSNEEFRLIYRPVVFDDHLKQIIESRYGNSNLINIQWPKASAIGLDKYSEMDQDNSLREYVNDMSGCKLLVMSYLTSFCKDAAFLEGCGVISNMIDSNNMLSNRHNHLFPTYMLPGVRIVDTVDGLIDNIKKLLCNPEQTKRESAEVISLWDYPATDFQYVLVSAVYGEQNSGVLND